MGIYNVSEWYFSNGNSMFLCKPRVINRTNGTLDTYASSEDRKQKNRLIFMRRRRKFSVFSGVFLIFTVVFGLQPAYITF